MSTDKPYFFPTSPLLSLLPPLPLLSLSPQSQAQEALERLRANSESEYRQKFERSSEELRMQLSQALADRQSLAAEGKRFKVHPLQDGLCPSPSLSPVRASLQDGLCPLPPFPQGGLPCLCPLGKVFLYTSLFPNM